MFFQFFGGKKYFIFLQTDRAVNSLQLGGNVEEGRRVYGRWSIKF